MKKIIVIVLITVCAYTIFSQDTKAAQAMQKTGFPYPFSELITAAIPLTAASNNAHTGIILPKSLLPELETILTNFQATEYPIILFFSKSTDSTLMDFIHAFYPQLQFLLIVNVSDDNTIIFDKTALTKTSLELLSFFDQKGEKTQFRLIDSFFYDHRTDNFGLEKLQIVLPEHYVLDSSFWNSLFLLFLKTTFTRNRIYMLPMLAWLIPIQADYLYIIVSLLFLINLIVYRIRAHSSGQFWIFFLTMVLTSVMLFYSLVITFYLLTLLLLKQIAGSSKLRYGIILFPILFWITVFLHDRLLFSIPAEMLAKVLVSSFIAISSIIIILIPPYSKKLPHTQDSNQ